ncbi:AbrB/MazE/SpoVT family DNA-binding domain-containing protein [Leadbettera azotonutricia]|uniref:Putative transcriptional regulator n=1 Tax=Leadbettera azotonutricia (strain ATCC BAA-888 / DSM 13862 / ZAS-9) TaxID=545695 RepID=F5YAX7_LEAAZ|nr:AbrB/MazE/SpoVT family DNA-binding domain-containing protein [Leadbettera azotonutricia]AEF82716.1 putative transcriptional regulator [Leadbettera azotonutricia ZAS-9]
MLVSVVPIGNSKGIRIPKNILTQLNIENEVEMNMHNNEIIIKRIEKKPRSGWEEAFQKMHKEGDDNLLLQEQIQDDSFEWEW